MVSRWMCACGGRHSNAAGFPCAPGALGIARLGREVNHVRQSRLVPQRSPRRPPRPDRKKIEAGAPNHERADSQPEPIKLNRSRVSRTLFPITI